MCLIASLYRWNLCDSNVCTKVFWKVPVFTAISRVEDNVYLFSFFCTLRLLSWFTKITIWSQVIVKSFELPQKRLTVILVLMEVPSYFRTKFLWHTQLMFLVQQEENSENLVFIKYLVKKIPYIGNGCVTPCSAFYFTFTAKFESLYNCSPNSNHVYLHTL